MRFPRRVIIYLREKDIPSSLITVVPISDPQLGDAAPPEFLARLKSSLPLLDIPPPGYASTASLTYIGQLVAIMDYLDELWDAGDDGFPMPQHSLRGTDPASRVHEAELLSLADECTVG